MSCFTALAIILLESPANQLRLRLDSEKGRNSSKFLPVMQTLFVRSQRLPKRMPLGRAELGLDERHGRILVEYDEAKAALSAVDPQSSHVAARELDVSDARFHDTILTRRKSFQSSADVRSGSMPCSRRSASVLYQSTTLDTFLSTAAR